MPEELKELVKATPPMSAVSLITGGKATYTSLDMTKEESKALYLEAMMDPTNKLSDFINKEIEIVHIVAHEVEMMNEDDGELVGATRIVLIDPENRSYSCVSWWVGRSIATITDVAGLPPFNPPVRVQVLQKETGDKRRKFVLKYLGRGKPVKTK